jgi:hypothetical protein
VRLQPLPIGVGSDVLTRFLFRKKPCQTTSRADDDVERREVQEAAQPFQQVRTVAAARGQTAHIELRFTPTERWSRAQRGDAEHRFDTVQTA